MTNYFSHDSNARNDEKILSLRMRHGWEGYGLYWAIIEKLRDSSDYTCVKDYNLIAFDLRCDAAKIKSIAEDFGLFAFTDDGKHIYSESLLLRMKKKDQVSEARQEAARKRWGHAFDANAMQKQNNSTASGIQTSANKSKVKENNNPPFPPLGECSAAGVTPLAERGNTGLSPHIFAKSITGEPDRTADARCTADSARTADTQEAAAAGGAAKSGRTAESGWAANSRETAEPGRAADTAETAEPGWTNGPGRTAAPGRFRRPTVEEVSAYCAERSNKVDPAAFVDFYESKGWMVGRNKMKNWQAAVRSWEKNGTHTQPELPQRKPIRL